MKTMEITDQQLQAENRRSDVRRFLEQCDILQITEIFREHQPVFLRDDMIDAIMKMGQFTIDAIFRAEALDEMPFDDDERDCK